MLDERDVGFDQPRLALVITQTGARIEGADVVQRLLHGFYGPVDRLRDFLVLLHLQRAQVLVNHGDTVIQHFRGRSISVFVNRELLLVVTKLAEQALAQIAAGYARGIELAHQFECFMQIGKSETRLVGGVIILRFERSCGAHIRTGCRVNGRQRFAIALRRGRNRCCHRQVAFPNLRVPFRRRQVEIIFYFQFIWYCIGRSGLWGGIGQS